MHAYRHVSAMKFKKAAVRDMAGPIGNEHSMAEAFECLSAAYTMC